MDLDSCLDAQHSGLAWEGHKLAPLVGEAVRLIILEHILHDFIILVTTQVATKCATRELIGASGTTAKATSRVSTKTTVSTEVTAGKAVTTSSSKVASSSTCSSIITNTTTIATATPVAVVATIATTIATAATTIATAATAIATTTEAATTITTTTAAAEATCPLVGMINPYASSIKSLVQARKSQV